LRYRSVRSFERDTLEFAGTKAVAHMLIGGIEEDAEVGARRLESLRKVGSAGA
jgi:hypothetical protein